MVSRPGRWLFGRLREVLAGASPSSEAPRPMPASSPQLRPVAARQAPIGQLPDPYTELVAAETALRTAIRLALGNAWQQSFTDDELKRLADKRTEEGRRRGGVAVSQDLLDYTEVYHFERIIIRKNWQQLQPILDDQQRTKVYLGIIADVRNTIAHSRPVVPAERLLLAGAAGQIQNQLAEYRSKLSGPNQHYASIDSARDSFGNDGLTGDPELHPRRVAFGYPIVRRLDVGDVVTFELTATDPRGRDLLWNAYSLADAWSMSVDTYRPFAQVTGSRAQIKSTVSKHEVGEFRQIVFIVANTGAYHRVRSWDDGCMFYYSVNPPREA